MEAIISSTVVIDRAMPAKAISGQMSSGLKRRRHEVLCGSEPVLNTNLVVTTTPEISADEARMFDGIFEEQFAPNNPFALFGAHPNPVNISMCAYPYPLF